MWALAQKGLAKRSDKIAWLKGEQGLGHHTATAIVREAEGKGWGSDADIINALFPFGSKERAAFDTIASMVRELGNDVTIVPCKTYVGFKRRRQFAVVRPASDGDLRIGLALEDSTLAPARALGSSRITTLAPAGEAKPFLRRAYEADV